MKNLRYRCQHSIKELCPRFQKNMDTDELLSMPQAHFEAEMGVFPGSVSGQEEDDQPQSPAVSIHHRLPSGSPVNDSGQPVGRGTEMISFKLREHEPVRPLLDIPPSQSSESLTSRDSIDTEELLADMRPPAASLSGQIEMDGRLLSGGVDDEADVSLMPVTTHLETPPSPIDKFSGEPEQDGIEMREIPRTDSEEV